MLILLNTVDRASVIRQDEPALQMADAAQSSQSAVPAATAIATKLRASIIGIAVGIVLMR